MDSVLEIVWLLGVALFYLWNASRRAKAKRTRQGAPSPEAQIAAGSTTGETKSGTPFQDFMAQMEEAMREASGEVIPEPEVEKPLTAPDTLKSAPIKVSKVPATSIPAARVEAFHDMGSFESSRGFDRATQTPHQDHGFGLDNPFSEERFERLPRGRDETEHAHGPLGPPLPQRRLSVAGRWRERLKDPKEAQDALVLAEIFGGPWKARRPHKR